MDENTGKCIDKNECEEDGNICAVWHNTKCVNFDGGYDCECKDGYNRQEGGDTPGKTCYDIDECKEYSIGLLEDGNQDPCLSCINTGGSFEVTCAYGVTFKKPLDNNNFMWVCEDIDECAGGSHACGENEQCRNIGGHTDA